jgi:anti-sigma factor RsiW
MDGCRERQKIGAWHDGALGGEKARRLEAHLAECGECAGELAALRALSAVLREGFEPAVMPRGLPARLAARLAARVIRTRERGLVRLAERLTAVAAAVLVFCVALILGGVGGKAPAVSSAAPWERTAVTLRLETASGEQQVARWIVQDLTTENGND